jgi:hypothetical protein
MWQNIVLNLVVPVPDSTRTDQKPVSIVFTNRMEFHCAYRSGRDYVMHVVTSFFLAWERHEMDEWLRFDGKMLCDPHANDKR